MKFFDEHLIPYNLDLRIFSEKPSSSNNGLNRPQQSCKKLGRSFDQLWRKGKKSKNTFFEHLIPYNPRFKTFSEKPSVSNNGPYCPLQSCQILGRSLELFWRKGQKSKKTPFLVT